MNTHFEIYVISEELKALAKRAKAWLHAIKKAVEKRLAELP